MTFISKLLTALAVVRIKTAPPTATDTKQNVTYHGLSENGVDKFLNIPYGQDTSGDRRFAPPVAYVFPPDVTHYNASAAGPLCAQPVGRDDSPGGAVHGRPGGSEDCLRLMVARPAGTKAGSKLPVMVFIQGGGLYEENTNLDLTQPDGLVAESVANGLPVVFVAMNYRVNIFGFALSKALGNDSLNIGLRDQRLALEWVQENIEYFGGDPNRVTIFGTDSGGFSVALQILAYGGTRPLPFHAAIIQSIALEPPSLGNRTLDAFNSVASLTNCTNPSNPDPQSPATLSCLRGLSMTALLNATMTDRNSKLDPLIGEIYFPTVDHDFLPLAPSELTIRGYFPRIPIIIGWSEDDLTPFTRPNISTASDTETWLSTYYPSLSSATIDTILSLYPSADFTARATGAVAVANHLHAEFYRTAQIFRDTVVVCPSFVFGHAMAQKYQTEGDGSRNRSATTTTTTTTIPVFYYAQNQTIFTSTVKLGLGIVHGSDMSYVLGNFTPWEHVARREGPPPTKADYRLLHRESRSWSTFANTGAPTGVEGKHTLVGWEQAYDRGDGMLDARVYVVGGGTPGMSGLEGAEALAKEKLRKRCEFLNREEVIRELRY